ncbi:hypothetical protein [Aquibium sp. ELW1220]|uniref:hypothetical protein n=1 Tax=Aquibium sp. ELW1220 TaxID=2976766 RepID=UPI0025AF7F16|nr:hypothetical protein [Aquibium sp. ELW1220]MDN2580146.1 hypothetical protein [Aquibium sp. ELW1220]
MRHVIFLLCARARRAGHDGWDDELDRTKRLRPPQRAIDAARHDGKASGTVEAPKFADA